MIQDTEYMYASAKIRASDGRDTPKVRLDRMIECRTIPQLIRTVLDFGFLNDSRQGTFPDLKSVLEASLDAAVQIVWEAVPDPAVYHFLLYKYDCNNLKVALKSNILGQDYSELYFRCGTVPVEDLAKRLSEEDYTALPPHMAKACAEASAAYAATEEVRTIDFLLDAACFADIRDNAVASGVTLFREYAETRADITNILTSVRLAKSRTAKEAAKALFLRAFVPGGVLPSSLFLTDGCADYEIIFDRMNPSPLKQVVGDILSDGEDVRPDALFDNYTYRLMAGIKYRPFGVEIPAAFLLTREAEIKNCRIVEAGLLAGLTPEKIRERIRADYV